VSGPPYYDPTSTVPGQTWDDVTATLTGPDTHAQPVAVTGPDGNGFVTLSIDTAGMLSGKYTVRITGRLLSQTATFTVTRH
jgi:ABC-type cobalamin transport system ATPase subunit